MKTGLTKKQKVTEVYYNAKADVLHGYQLLKFQWRIIFNCVCLK